MKSKKANTGKIYGAYGSNINLEQMQYRCPQARVLGTGWLNGYRLVFRGSGVASVIPAPGERTPVLLWEITEECEKALDRYEGYPNLYRKETLTVETADGKENAMLYVINKPYANIPRPPWPYYYATIREGYEACNLPIRYLQKAIINCGRECDQIAKYIKARKKIGTK